MIRRYDMSRSDNAPLGSRCMMPCTEGNGHFNVYAGFNVSSVSITPIGIPSSVRMFVDDSSLGDVSFRVIYENVPKGMNSVEFYFVAQ